MVNERVRKDITIRLAVPQDRAEISDLHARAFGPGRFVRTAYRVREGTPAFSPFCRVCLIDARLVAAVRFTAVRVGGKGDALLLGPLAVDPAFANQGYGRGLMDKALEDARAAGIKLVVLVGDEPYYARLGFRRIAHGKIGMPGPVDPNRLLAVELTPGALAEYSGRIAAPRETDGAVSLSPHK